MDCRNTSSSDLMVLLAPGAVTMSVLAITYLVYNRISGAHAISPDARLMSHNVGSEGSGGAPRVVVGPRKNAFEHRKSVFDTTGNLLTSWKHEGQPGEKHETSGGCGV